MWTARRAAHELRRRSGFYVRSTPVAPWTGLPRGLDDAGCVRALDRLAATVPFGAPKATTIRGRVASPGTCGPFLSLVDRRSSAVVEMFGARREVPWPFDFLHHPESGEQWPTGHWSTLDDFGRRDVKWLWELGRLSYVYDLVRADGHSDGRSSAALATEFVALVDTFRDHAPRNSGPQWMCAQESSIRAIAVLVGASWFHDPSTTIQPGVRSAAGRVLELLEASGERIEANDAYARVQANNHTLNEALALWLLGVLVPDLERAARWADHGSRRFVDAVLQQFAPDGSYVQQSLGYQRFALESCALALSIARCVGWEWPEELKTRVGVSAELLADLTDPSGKAPNYGSTDSARLFRFDDLDVDDFRPSISAALTAAGRSPRFEPGPHDEPLIWLGLDHLANHETQPTAFDLRREVRSPDGGYLTLLSKTSWAFTRAYRQDHRPAQADQLAVDLWWHGVNLVADPGTFSYDADPPWNNTLALTAAHNTVTIDGESQMQRGPNFLWLSRAHGSLRRRAEGRQWSALEMEHDGYRRLGVCHRRALVRVGDDPTTWFVIDDVLDAVRRGDDRSHGRATNGEDGSGHIMHMRWCFPSGVAALEGAGGGAATAGTIATAVGTTRFALVATTDDLRVRMVRSDPHSTEGWFSPTYGHRQPAYSMVVSASGHLPVRFVTVFHLDDAERLRSAPNSAVTLNRAGAQFGGVNLELNAPGADTVVRGVGSG